MDTSPQPTPVLLSKSTRPTVLALGVTSRESTGAARESALSAGLELSAAATAADVGALLRGNRSPRAVLVDLDGAGARASIAMVRDHETLASLPVIGFARTVTDLTFAELLEAGGDDIVNLSTDALSVRLRALPVARRTRINGARLALVAAGTPSARNALARPLREVGYAVDFAGDTDDLRERWEQSPPHVVVVDAKLPGQGGARAVVEAHAAGLRTPTVVVATPRLAAETRALLATTDRTAVLDAFAPPDGVVFLANELTSGVRVNQRASPRVLFGTRVWLRRAGDDNDVVGYSYTVSEGGIFVRTLAPFATGDEVWVELIPPRCSRRVRLAAQVRWTRRFGRVEDATAPAGVGLMIDGGLPGDGDRYRQGCRALATELGYSR